MKQSLLKIIFLLFSPGVCLAQWQPNPVTDPVCTAPDNQIEPRIVSDMGGGAIITWIDFRNDPQKGDIYVQRMNSMGYPLWTLSGLAVCTDLQDQGAVSICEAGGGSVILAWNDWRNGQRDIYAQKIDSSGNILWTAGGAPVVTTAGTQQDPKVLSDGAGGAIIVWQDSSGTNYNVYAQRMSSSGTQMWASSGVVVCNAAFHQINPRLESDLAGGAIVTWQDGRNGIDYDIYAQRINASGVVQWATNGIVIASGNGTQSNPKIEPDGSGGAIIAWQDKRNGNYDIYAQRVNGSGNIQWTSNGVAICSAVGSQSAVDMTAKGGINGAIITWKDDRSGNSDVYAQRINLAGIVQWTVNGVPVATHSGPELKANIAFDGMGGAIITWQDSTYGSWDVMSSKIDSSGVIPWTSVVCSAASQQTNPKNISDGTGGCIYTWVDSRDTISKDIYAQRLNSSGYVGMAELSSQSFFTVYPNPLLSQATLQTTKPLINASLGIYDLQGQLVKEINSINGQTIIICRDNLAAGMYFFRLVQDNKVIATDKLMIAD